MRCSVRRFMRAIRLARLANHLTVTLRFFPMPKRYSTYVVLVAITTPGRMTIPAAVAIASP